VLSLFGTGYAEESSAVLLLLAIASIPSGINELYVTVYRTELKVVPVILIRFVTASLIIISGYFFMTTVGMIGIGYGWLATELIVMFCITPFIFKKLVKSTAS
jgi:O-antigen/teichoic acid export membrane protein